MLLSFINPGVISVASGPGSAMVTPESPSEPEEKPLESSEEDSNPLVNVERVTPPVTELPSPSKHLGGPPDIFIVSPDGLTAIIAAICLRQLRDKGNVQNHDSIRYGSLDTALPVDSKLFIEHARMYYDGIDIKGWKIPRVATDEEIASAKKDPGYDPQDFVSGASAKMLVAIDTATKFRLENKFPAANIKFAGNVTSLWDIKPVIENFAKKIRLISSP